MRLSCKIHCETLVIDLIIDFVFSIGYENVTKTHNELQRSEEKRNDSTTVPSYSNEIAQFILHKSNSPLDDLFVIYLIQMNIQEKDASISIWSIQRSYHMIDSSINISLIRDQIICRKFSFSHCIQENNI